MAMTEIRYDRGLEREREREGEDRRNEEMKKERTMVWIRVKRDRKKGRWWGGENVTEVGVVSTAPHCRALSPLLALPPLPSSLERALYF